MKSLKVLGTIGIILFSLCFLGMCGWTPDTASGAIGCGVIATLYGIALAIVAVVKAKKQ